MLKDSTKRLVNASVSALLALTACHSSFAQSTSQEPQQEKCYGIVKAGSNDCNTATTSCAGSSTKDNQRDAFIFLPKGVCEKIVNGQLSAVISPEKK